jgi:dTDP-4-amino-4,6-dideoxygalactose transaminase
MIPYGRQYIDEDDISSVTRALTEDFLTTGPLVEVFESQLSELNNAKTFVVNSGTAALHCAYQAIGIDPGDEIITPPNTFVATQATAINLGARVIFADVELSTGLISVSEIEKAITKRTKAVVAVDYAGQPCDIESIREAINGRDIYIIQDAAHSLGSVRNGEPTGALADLTTYSFFATKNITTGEGGAVSSISDNLWQKAYDFSRQGLVKDKKRFLYPSDGPWHQEVHEFGLNYRLTDFQCALGISQLKKIRQFKSRRKEIRRKYISVLENQHEIQILEELPGNDPMWHLFPIRVPHLKRKPLVEYLRDKGILTQVNYVPAYWHPAFRNLGFQKGLCPKSEEFYNTEISLPMHVSLTDAQIEFICGSILEFLEG